MTPKPGCYAVTTREITRNGPGWFSPATVIAEPGAWAIVHTVYGVFAQRVKVVFLGSWNELDLPADCFEFHAEAPAARVGAL